MEMQNLRAMHMQEMPISRDTIYRVLQKCIKSKDLPAGKQAHCLMVSSGLHFVAVLGDLLIRFFALCGCLLDANLAFCNVSQPSVYTWHAIISAHATLGESKRALELYRRMQEKGIKPDKVLFLCILKACGNIGALEQGSLIYKQLIRNGLVRNAAIQSALIDMYAKCGSMDDACKVFDVFAKQDVVIWSTMIAAYARHNHCFPALELYKKMHYEGIQPDKVTFLCVLKAVSSIEEVKVGKVIHHEIIMRENEADVVLGSTLVDMYAKCGSMEDAHVTFDKLPNRNAVTWNAVIAGYVLHGHSYSALELYSRMQQQGSLKPEKVTFLCTLKACGSIGVIEQGRLIHDQIIRSGLEWDFALENTIIDMYAKCGSIDEACKVFNEVPNREVVSWNSLIGGYIQQGQSLHALGLFEDMQQEGVLPDKVTYSCALKACASMEALDHGKLMHDQITRMGLEADVVVGSALADMYCKCKSLKEGSKAFEKLQSRNVVSWNAIISGYVQYDHDHSALELFQQMQQEGVEPNDVTFSCILKACSNLGNIEEGKLVHDGIIRCGFEIDAVLVCALVDIYAKCGSLNESRWVFDRLPNRNVAAWAAMIVGYAQHGDSLDALELFQKMQEEGVKPDKVTFLCVLKASSMLGAVEDGKLIHDQILRDDFGSDVVVGNTLVDMYAKCSKLDEARKLFDELPMRDVVSWGAMIAGYAQHGDGVAALELFEEMEEEGKEPERSTFLCILKACGSVGALEQGKVVHEKIIRQGFNSDLAIGNTLVDMYAKCGRMKDANKMFQGLSSRDVVSWNAMIAGYAMQGNYSLVRLCLKDMQQHGLNPDSKTYTSILATCSHAGEVEEGLEFFKSMRKDHGIKPSIEHFNCMIDALGRSGCLKDAEELLQSMPVLPDNTGWVSLLASCRIHGNMNLGSHCFNRVVEIDPDFASGYVLMSSIYADSHKLMDVGRLGELRKSVSAWKKPGKAWIEVQKKMQEFVVGDYGHPQSDSCHFKLARIENNLKEEGYMPNLDVVLEPILDGDKGKGVITLGFLTSIEGVNLRCAGIPRLWGNVRNASKLVFKFVKRKITLRNAYNIHNSSLSSLMALICLKRWRETRGGWASKC